MSYVFYIKNGNMKTSKETKIQKRRREMQEGFKNSFLQGIYESLDLNEGKGIFQKSMIDKYTKEGIWEDLSNDTSLVVSEVFDWGKRGEAVIICKKSKDKSELETALEEAKTAREEAKTAHKRIKVLEKELKIHKKSILKDLD